MMPANIRPPIGRNNDLEAPCRLVSGGPHGDDSCRGTVGAIAACDEITVVARRAVLAGDVAAHWRRVVAGPPASRRDCGMGALLLAAEVSAGCGVLVLFLRGHLHHGGLRRFGAAERMATTRS